MVSVCVLVNSTDYQEARKNKRGLWKDVITSDKDAIKAAKDFLMSKKMDWSEPTGVRRTVANWYRVEFGVHDSGVERVVLVNPENGHAGFPLRR